MTIAVGDPLPDVPLTMMDGSSQSLASHKGKALVLYFYPKDDTPGCTKQAQGFSDFATDFAALGVDILGVSKDTPAKHTKFTAKHDLSIPLATDDGSALEAFGAWVEKSLYGRNYMGIDRSTLSIRRQRHAHSRMAQGAGAGPCRGGVGSGAGAS